MHSRKILIAVALFNCGQLFSSTSVFASLAELDDPVLDNHTAAGGITLSGSTDLRIDSLRWTNPSTYTVSSAADSSKNGVFVNNMPVQIDNFTVRLNYQNASIDIAALPSGKGAVAIALPSSTQFQAFSGTLKIGGDPDWVRPTYRDYYIPVAIHYGAQQYNNGYWKFYSSVQNASLLQLDPLYMPKLDSTAWVTKDSAWQIRGSFCDHTVFTGCGSGTTGSGGPALSSSNALLRARVYSDVNVNLTITDDPAWGKSVQPVFWVYDDHYNQLAAATGAQTSHSATLNLGGPNSLAAPSPRPLMSFNLQGGVSSQGRVLLFAK